MTMTNVEVGLLTTAVLTDLTQGDVISLGLTPELFDDLWGEGWYKDKTSLEQVVAIDAWLKSRREQIHDAGEMVMLALMHYFKNEDFAKTIEDTLRERGTN